MPDDFAQPKKLGAWGGRRVRGEQASNRNLKGGTNRAYLLARLERDGREDLVEDIHARRLSAFAAAVLMGWSRRPPTVHAVDRNQARGPAVIDVKALIG